MEEEQGLLSYERSVNPVELSCRSWSRRPEFQTESPGEADAEAIDLWVVVKPRVQMRRMRRDEDQEPEPRVVQPLTLRGKKGLEVAQF